jgi:SAM-dependent methyltransferase
MTQHDMLVCPETFGRLERRDGGWWSPQAGRLYPERDGLVFMGFPAADAAMIAETMEEEREWQGTTANIDRDRDFLRRSAPIAVEFINLISRLLQHDGRPQALDLGSGSGWVSWLLAEAGYVTWLCDFEPNSLAIGQVFQHDRLRDRIVTDGRYAPFAEGAFDVVVMKEFVHHVRNYDGLFQEAQRVLRPGGLMALMEPVRSIKRTVYELRHPDPHKGHHIVWPDRYRRAIRRAGMTLAYETATYGYDEAVPRNAMVRRARARAARETAGMRPLTPFAQIQIRLLGGASIVLLGKKTQPARAQPRPSMELIDPGALRVSDAERDAFREFRGIIEDAARGLHRIGGASE